MKYESLESNLIKTKDGDEGTKGDSAYIHIKFSNDGGTTFTSNNGEEPGEWLGQYSDHIETDSNDVAKYTWTKIAGEAGEDAYSVILTNEAISFSADRNMNVTESQNYTCEIMVFQGAIPRTDFAIGSITAPSPITATISNKILSISVSKGSKFSQTSGSITVPVTIDNITITKQISYSLSKEGKDGSIGKSAIIGQLSNDYIGISTDTAGNNGNYLQAQSTLTIYEGTQDVSANWTCTASATSGITGSLTGKTYKITNMTTDTGTVTLTASCGGYDTIVKKIMVSKIKNGAPGRNYILSPSALVLKRDTNKAYSPATVTFSAYYRDGQSTTQNTYAGRFRIEETLDGESYTVKYTSSANETNKIYTPSNTGITAIRCTLYAAGDTTQVLDIQSVVILEDIDISEVQEEFEHITSTMTTISSKVDAIDNKIVNMVTQSDIDKAINKYDGSTVETIRDRVSKNELDINGMLTTISDIQSKYDGEIQTLTENISKVEQDATKFQTTVSSTYATKTELNTKYDSVTSQFTQLSDKFEWIVASGTSASDFTLTDRMATLTAEYINLHGLVTFSGLNSATQNTINSASTNATNAATKVTNLQQTGLGWKVNYSAFSTKNDGECYFHGFNATTGAASDIDGWVWWNGEKITIPKGMHINPNTICPYNTVIYLVHRTSASARYLVWYNSGWKYAVTPTPTAVEGTWTWNQSTDIVLASFIEPSSEGAITGAILFTPPKTADDIIQSAELTSNINTAKTSAISTATSDATTKANNALSSAKSYAESAVNWVNTNGSNAVDLRAMVMKWTNNAVSLTTQIQGGWIATNTITAEQIAVDTLFAEDITATGSITGGTFIGSIIKSKNYVAGKSGSIIDMNAGTMNIGNGKLVYDGTNLSLSGSITATSGYIGGTSGWNISNNTITGNANSKIISGILESSNFAESTSGVQINLNTGVIKGNVEATQLAAKEALQIYNGSVKRNIVTGFSADSFYYTMIGCDLTVGNPERVNPSIIFNKATSGEANLITINATAVDIYAQTTIDGAFYAQSLYSYSTLTTQGNAAIVGRIDCGSLNSNGAATIAGSLTVNGQFICKNAGLELYHNTPYIDFHYNQFTDDHSARIICSGTGLLDVGYGGQYGGVRFNSNSGWIFPITSGAFSLGNSNNRFYKLWLTTAGIDQTSLASKKTEIRPFINALAEIDQTDVFNFKGKDIIERDGDDIVRTGFVIGDGYKISNYLLSDSKEGIDLYSAIGVTFAGVKELYELIKQQQQEIKKLQALIEEKEKYV